MLKEKYEYKSIDRVTVNGNRHYQTPTGSPLPSVTTVLSSLADKTAIYEWRKRVGNEEANRITKLATGIGTQVHLHLEKYILEEDRPGGTNLIHQMAHSLSDIVIERGLSNIDEVWIDDYFLQCAAYAEAHNQLYGTEIKTSVIMMIGWDAEADNLGNYQEFVVQDEEYDKYSLQWANKVQEYFDKFM